MRTKSDPPENERRRKSSSCCILRANAHCSGRLFQLARLRFALKNDDATVRFPIEKWALLGENSSQVDGIAADRFY